MGSPKPPGVERFLTQLATERRLSAATCEAYARDLDVLCRLADGTSLDQLNVHDIRRFIARMHGEGRSGKTLARMLSAWRTYYRYACKTGQATANPCAALRPPKSPKRLPGSLSPDQATQLLDTEPDNVLEQRDKAMFELFYSSGLRLSELAGLNLEDLNFTEGVVRVTGKGSKTRVVPVGRYALDALRAWLPLRAAMARAPAVFVGRHGDPLSPRAIQLRLKRWAARQGIAVNVHPHILRHSFASHILQSSGDLRAVQELLGHASISTTQIYTHLDFQHLAKVYDSAHPRAKKKTGE